LYAMPMMLLFFVNPRCRRIKGLKTARQILEEDLHLKMHPENKKVVHFDEGFRFLGCVFWKDYMIFPKDKIKKQKDKIRSITRRQQGRNTEEMIIKLNEVVRGFGNYNKLGNVKKVFQRLDQWIRMRVRAFIRKKRSTVSNRLIPNNTLAGAGLVSLEHLLTTRS
jgi:RNA-directed DNA polymerase